MFRDSRNLLYRLTGERPRCREDVGGTQTVNPDRLIAILFMHELGHTLGLGHGGNDNIHYKPNYVPVGNGVRWRRRRLTSHR